MTSPWFWAAGATWIFYQFLPHSPVFEELLVRYFCSHPLEYILAGLFFTGLTIIVIKSVLMIFERNSFRAVPDFGIDEPRDEMCENVATFEAKVRSAGGVLSHTYWGRRLHHLLAFFKGRNSSEGLTDHLTYLSEASTDRMHSSHALLQTVIWSIPIIGFLGTVMGITLAIANVTPDQLDTSLNEVTGGLAIAFDTTALALSLSLILGFASLFAKRSEEVLLAEIDERCRLEVHRCFPLNNNSSAVFLDAEAKAAETLIFQTNALISKQTGVWTDAVQSIRKEWSSTIEQQRQELVNTLVTGTDMTLSDHARQLSEFREQFLQAQSDVTDRLAAELNRMELERQNSEQQLTSSLDRFATKIDESASRHVEQQTSSTREILGEFAGRVEHWQAQFESWQQQFGQLTEALLNQTDAVHGQSMQLAKIVESEDTLVRLQRNLDHNLDTLRTSGSFEETLHHLTAAVHLLTARTRREAA